ncbi:MAG: ATP-dependent Clp protease adaptor ClpS [Bacteroidetes bacterium]|nr:ATP-dependent Clp protease adaptor ClpS [Bacteroidota bacterium]
MGKYEIDLATVFWPHTEVVRAESLTQDYSEEDVIVSIDLPLKVMLFNDNFHTFHEVIGQICKATGTTRDRAEAHAWEVHTKGKSVVFDGDMGECLRVSSVLEEIALHTQILS